MSASQRSASLVPSRMQAARKKSRDVRETLTTGEAYHRVTKWYPSISDTPEETVVLTVNGAVPSQGGTKSRTESRLGTSSTGDQLEPPPEPTTRTETRAEKAGSKLLQVSNLKE